MIRSINIRTKIIVAMLAAATFTGVSQFLLVNKTIKEGFAKSLDEQLSAVASTTASRVESYFEHSRSITHSLADNSSIVNALQQFDDSVKELDSVVLEPDMQARLVEFYSSEYAPSLALNEGAKPLPEAFMPAGDAERYLQYHYIAANPEPVGSKSELSDAEDGSRFSKVHSVYHPRIKSIRDEFSFADIFLINNDGLVVYSTIKEVDFLTDLQSGAFNDSGLAAVFRSAKKNRAARPVTLEDYSFYFPSAGAPSFFLASPVYANARFIGVIAVQLLDSRLNEIVNLEGRWEDLGLGESGDVFLIANDGTLRSSLRSFDKSSEDFVGLLKRNRIASSITDDIVRFDTPISLVSAENRLPDIDNSGSTRVVSNFSNDMTRSLVRPMSIRGLDWNVAVEVPVTQSRQPIVDFQRLMMIALALTVSITTVGAMMFAGVFTRPLNELIARFKKVSSGELSVVAPLPQADEIGETSRAASEMVSCLHQRIGIVERADDDTKQLLLRFLPDGVVRMIGSRKHEGEDKLDDIAKVVPDATFVFASLIGHENILKSLPPAQAVDTLDQLIQIIDLAAEKHDVEKIRASGSNYLAVAGLSTPQIDHKQRGFAFATELQSIVARFTRDFDASVTIKIGIASGAALSGVIGRQKVNFDIWGQAVSDAERLHNAAAVGEIRVTQEYAAALKEIATFTASEDLKSGGMIAAQKSKTAGKEKA